MPVLEFLRHNAREIAQENRLEPITQRPIIPLNPQDADEYAALMNRFTDYAIEEASLKKQLLFVTARKEAVMLKMDQVLMRRPK